MFKLRHFVDRFSFGRLKLVIGLICLSNGTAFSQQFAGDNQWVAPEGVATLVGTFGQKYMMLDITLAVHQEWELNLQSVHYYNDPGNKSESYKSPSIYVKRRLKQNANETAGYAVFAGTGVFPQHLDRGEVTTGFRSWWAMGVATYAFSQDRILLDVLPGAIVNLDHEQTGKTAWGFTYSSRVAFYKIIPHSAVVAEVFGTSGEAKAPISYRGGIRWESRKWVVTGTYSNSFNNTNGAGLEIGLVFFTERLWGKSKE